jgi:hypothetical protein
MRDRVRSQDRDIRLLMYRHSFREVNLDVSTEELLNAERAFTYADVYAMCAKRNAVVWITPHAALVRGVRRCLSWEMFAYELEVLYEFSFSANDKDIVALASSPEHLLEICDVVLRLLAASVVHSVRLENLGSPRTAINAATLAHLMEHCQSLKVLKLQSLVLDKKHCRVLGTYSRPDLEIVMHVCGLTNSGKRVLAEVLGRNQGPTNIDCCHFDYALLANGLRGNSRLKSLSIKFSRHPEIYEQELLTIAGVLKENKGLVRLELCGERLFSYEAWDAICDSLKTHPTLEVLAFQSSRIERVRVLPLHPVVLKVRIQALVDMLKVNLSIHTIHRDSRYSEDKIFSELVIPYLKLNRLRPRLLAIQKTRPIGYRVKVLGRALLAVRTDPNRFWILLSGNPEVAFQSTTAARTTRAARFYRRFSKCTLAFRFSKRFCKCTLTARFCRCRYSDEHEISPQARHWLLDI